MALGDLFSNVAAKLFGAGRDDVQAVDAELVDLVLDAVIETVDPRLRTISGYRKKLAQGIAVTIRHLRSLAQDLPQFVELARDRWGDDPLLNAMFATADDVRTTLGNSPELRAWFDAHPAADEAYALLGMLKVERSVFAPALVDGQLRHDVAQTTVSFTRHKLVAPAADFAACRRQVGILIFKRLATLALARITELGERAAELDQRKAMLGSRLRLLRLKGEGIEQLAGAPGNAAEIDQLERELATTAEEAVETKGQLATLATRLAHVEAVFNSPADNVNLARVELRVNRMGYKLAPDSPEPCAELKLSELAIGEGLKVIIAIVHCRRADLPPKETLAARAARGVF